MNITLSGVFAEAAALWRGDRDLWLRIASVLFFLPALALQMFAPYPDTAGQTAEAVAQMGADWYAANFGWMFAQVLVQTIGMATILGLVLDRARPTLGQAMVRGLRLVPGLVLVSLCVTLLAVAGVVLLILPGLYVIGRTALANAAYVDNPRHGPFGAITASVEHTRNRGWLLFLAVASVFFTTFLFASIGDSIASVAGAGEAARLIGGVLVALVGAVGSLAQVLVQAAAYRLFTASSNGI